MALNMVIHPVAITSNNGADVNGAWIHVGGMSFDVQFHGPAALHRIEVSADKADADIATGADGAAVTALAAVYREVRERPEWARVVILNDAGGPRIFTAELMIHKEDF